MLWKFECKLKPHEDEEEEQILDCKWQIWMTDHQYPLNSAIEDQTSIWLETLFASKVEKLKCNENSKTLHKTAVNVKTLY